MAISDIAWLRSDEHCLLDLIEDWPVGSITRISLEYRLEKVRAELAEVLARDAASSQIPSPRNDHGLPV